MSDIDGRQRLERIAVVLIAAHTFGVGLALLFFAREGAALGGWAELEPLFFARQAGVFHLLIGTAYLLEYFRGGSVLLLLIAKSTAVVFLLGVTLLDGAPWVVPVSAMVDGMMGGAVLVLRRRTGRALGGYSDRSPSSTSNVSSI